MKPPLTVIVVVYAVVEHHVPVGLQVPGTSAPAMLQDASSPTFIIRTHAQHFLIIRAHMPNIFYSSPQQPMNEESTGTTDEEVAVANCVTGRVVLLCFLGGGHRVTSGQWVLWFLQNISENN